MAEITLEIGKTTAMIETNGAVVSALYDGEGAVLFSRGSLENAQGDKKQRGGCHVCVPNFGPGGASGLSQHGFGRELAWGVAAQTDTSLELLLTTTDETYRGLTARLNYHLQETSFLMELTLTNSGDTPLAVAPAFHPYFAHAGAVELNETALDLAALEGTEFVRGDHQTLAVAGRTLTLTSENLPVWAVWTDQLADYVCVEPSHSGNSFVETTHGTPRQLANAETARYSCAIDW